VKHNCECQLKIFGHLFTNLFTNIDVSKLVKVHCKLNLVLFTKWS